MDNLKEPRITIVIATYNRAHVLERALTSLQRQTFKAWKAIIVDDGSGDASKIIASQFVEQDDRFSLVESAHKGAPIARNTAHRLVTTPYITYLDSDDEYKPDHLATRLVYLEEHPEIDLIHGGLEVIGDEMVPDRFDPTKRISVYECVVCPTIVTKTEVVKKLGGFKPLVFASDAEFVDRAKRWFTIAKVDIPTYVYHREGGESITHQVARDNNAVLNA